MLTRFGRTRDRVESWTVILLLVLIALTPISSKAINLAWILIVVTGVGLLALSSRTKDLSQDYFSLRPALSLLAAFFTGGLVLKIGMQLFWGESVQGIAFEITAATAVGISWVMAAHWRTKHAHFTLLAGALLVASGLALFPAYQYTYAGETEPTNPVNWGAGLALFMCIALAIWIHKKASGRVKLFAVLSMLCFSLALIISGRRGAFFAILWVAGWPVYFWLRDHQVRRTWSIRIWAPLLLAVSVTTILLASNPQLPMPVQRIISTVEEVSIRLSGVHPSANETWGNLGSRLYQYEQGLRAGATSPMFGLGAKERKRLIELAEAKMGSALFHMHNEYLQAWVAYGIPGLLGALCLPIGLVIAGWKLRRNAPLLALTLAGFGSVHFVSGLTNVNTFHNYYTSVFAVCIVISFMFLRNNAEPPKS